MTLSRRGFLAQSLVAMSSMASAALPSHVVLLGDSVLDNGRYTEGKPAVIAQLGAMLPAGWKATLLAVDGATTKDIPAQLARLPAEATHLVLSIGGNDALARTGILDMPVKSSAQALLALAAVAKDIEAGYAKAVSACLQRKLPLVACTIYNGNFADASYQKRASIALAVINDVILRTAIRHGLTVLELREICSRPEDFFNAIEPSSAGGAKIARAIVQALTAPPGKPRGAQVIGSV